MTPILERRDLAWLLILVLGFSVFCAAGITTLPIGIYDEVYTLPAAKAIAAGQMPFEQTHPPLSKLLMAIGYLFAKASTHREDWAVVALGARLASLVAAGFTLAGTYFLVRCMTQVRAAAILSTTLLGLDGVFYVLSRTAMTNMFAASFAVWGVACVWLAIARGRNSLLWSGGVLLGLGVACRWTTAIALACCLVAAMISLAQRRRALMALGVVPILAYFSTYLQTLWSAANGHILSLDSLVYVLQLQQYALQSHIGYDVPNLNASPWWSWPLMLTPPWFAIQVDLKRNVVGGVLTLGNACVWWAAIPILLYALFRALRMRDRLHGFLALLGIAPWLVWACVHSNASLMHYFFESLVPVCVLLGIYLAARPVWMQMTYLGCALAWTIHFYPLQAGVPMSLEAYARLMPPTLENWELGARTRTFRQRNHLEDPAAYEAFKAKYYPDIDTYMKNTAGHPFPRPGQPVLGP